MSIWFSSNAFAYEFKCDVELYTSTGTEKLTLFSENENIQANLAGHDTSIQFAQRQDLGVPQDYYNFRIFGPDTDGMIFSGNIIQNCGFGTRSVLIICMPVQ